MAANRFYRLYKCSYATLCNRKWMKTIDGKIAGRLLLLTSKSLAVQNKENIIVWEMLYFDQPITK